MVRAAMPPDPPAILLDPTVSAAGDHTMERQVTDVKTTEDMKTTPALKVKPRAGRTTRKPNSAKAAAQAAAGVKVTETKGKTATKPTAKVTDKPKPTEKELETAREFAKQVKAHADKNQERGGGEWGKVLKKWDQAEVVKTLVGVDTINGARKRVLKLFGVK